MKVEPSKTNEPKVEFTQRQLDWLDKQYPELVATASTSEAEMRFRAGQRSVIVALRSRVQQIRE